MAGFFYTLPACAMIFLTDDKSLWEAESERGVEGTEFLFC